MEILAEIPPLSYRNQYILEAFDKGYRIKNGIIYNPKGKMIKGSICSSGYRNFSLNSKIGGRPVAVPVSRFVAYQKYGNIIFQKGIQVRHLNGNCLDNADDNIAIGTPSDNAMDKCPKVRMSMAIKASNKIRKFSDKTVAEIKHKNKVLGVPYSELMKEYGITSKGTLSYLINNDYVTAKEC